jgi:hypothetical protein
MFQRQLHPFGQRVDLRFADLVGKSRRPFLVVATFDEHLATAGRLIDMDMRRGKSDHAARAMSVWLKSSPLNSSGRSIALASA